MDEDLNTYDVEHVCTSHPLMSKPEWEDIYQEAWLHYYTPAHMRTLMRRAVATGMPVHSLVKLLVTFRLLFASRTCTRCKPASCGSCARRRRRPGLPAKAR